MEFLFFPAVSITQLDKNSFKLTDIYGGEFKLGFLPLVSYLLQEEDKNKEPSELEDFGISPDLHDTFINTFLEHKIIYSSKIKKESTFHKKRVLEQIIEQPFHEQRILNMGDVTLELTQKCPYNCAGCFREINNEEILSIQEIKKLINDLYVMGLKKISLSGGEITASKEAFDRLKFVASFAQEIGIENIRLLTSGFIPEKVKESVNYGINEIQISIDGFKEYHDNYRKFQGAFERAIKSIELCQNLDIKLISNTVVTQNNLGQVGNLIDFLSEFNIDTLRVTKITSPNKNLRLSIPKAKKLYKMIQEKQKKYGFQRIINPYGVCSNVLNCVGGIVYAHIGATGNVFACDYLTKDIVGNIRKESFQKIWTDSEMLIPFRTPTKINEKCGNCLTRALCFGNCRIDKGYVEITQMCEQHNK